MTAVEMAWMAAIAVVAFLVGRLVPRGERCTTVWEDSGDFWDSQRRCKAPPDKRCAAGHCTAHCRKDCGSACIKRWEKMMEPVS